MKIKLKQDILEIPKGTEVTGYGHTDEPDCHLFPFDGEYGKSIDMPYEHFTWEEFQSEFTVSESFVRRHPELFEIVGE